MNLLKTLIFSKIDYLPSVFLLKNSSLESLRNRLAQKQRPVNVVESVFEKYFCFGQPLHFLLHTIGSKVLAVFARRFWRKEPLLFMRKLAQAVSDEASLRTTGNNLHNI